MDTMRKFDTNVQTLKYKVLREVSRQAWLGNESFDVFNEIAKEVVKKDENPKSCCIYKDRAIVAERIKIALGGDKTNPNVIEVIDIACDECPVAGHVVTDLCRGCIAHKCADACKPNAIHFDDEQMAHIDKHKCVECGKCAKVCPYSAITNFKRPCEKACKVNAIHMAEEGEAEIDNAKCISCGACVYQCPFGATVDKSFVVDVIHLIQKSEENTKYKVHAIVAPSIASQFKYTKLTKIIRAIKELGFYAVREVALGADMVAAKEAKELEEKGFLTTSCCPAFVQYVRNSFPMLADNISHNLSPMGEMAKFIKDEDPSCKVVFIGPCTAKKAEIRQEPLKDYVDYVLTFEELQALIDGKNIDVEHLEPLEMEDASYFGRIFARGGGVAEAVGEALKEQGSNFEYKPIACEGIDKCKTALLKASKNVLPFNIIEGMACEGGCVGGAGCLTHDDKYRGIIDEYGKEAKKKTILE
ncbi:MAG: 4Fe-4S dicluster domain-containing protein [Anaerovoracaceae bacterium]